MAFHPSMENEVHEDFCSKGPPFSSPFSLFPPVPPFFRHWRACSPAARGRWAWAPIGQSPIGKKGLAAEDLIPVKCDGRIARDLAPEPAKESMSKPSAEKQIFRP